MRGKLLLFSSRTRVRLAPLTRVPHKIVRKAWPWRRLDRTAAPLWWRRLRRNFRHLYRDWVALQMQVVSAALYRVEVRGVECFNHSPSTLITCGHKRDMDLPIIIPRLYLFQRPGRRQELKLMYLAARDDMYERGFLTVYFAWLDRLKLRPLLARLSLNGYFHFLQVCPVKLPDEQTANQLLNETMRLEGNLPALEALTPEWQARLLPDTAGYSNLKLSDAILKAPLEVISQYATPRMFQDWLAARIRQRHHATMHRQLLDITGVVDKGNSLIVLPEGRITPDGRFSKMRAAVVRLVKQTRAETRLLPVNLTYDFMDTARPNVTMLVGPEVADLKHLPKSELSELIRYRVSSLTCVSMSGLAARWLVAAAEEGQAQVRLDRMRAQIWQEARRLDALGLPLDRQLQTRTEFDRRFERFVVYARRTGLLLDAPGFAADSGYPAAVAESSLSARLNLPALLRAECLKHSDNPVRYCYNELTELLETLAALPGRTQPAEITSLAALPRRLDSAG